MWVAHDRWISNPLHWANIKTVKTEPPCKQSLSLSFHFLPGSIHLVIMQPSTFQPPHCFTCVIIVTIITSRKSQWIIRRKILIRIPRNESFSCRIVKRSTINKLLLVTVSQHRGLLCNSNVSPTWPHRICCANRGSNIYATFAVFSAVSRLYDSNIDTNILTFYNNEILTTFDLYFINTE